MNWYGFSLSLLTAVLWGVLPVFLKLCLQVTDSVTITWYRFTFAAFFVAVVLVRQRALPPLGRLSRSSWWLLIAAALALVANYVANVESLEYIDPESVQIVMQLAPFLLMLGGIFLFGERFNRFEGFGVICLFIGLSLFFSPNFDVLLGSLNQYSTGVLIVVFAAVTWAAYALAQKSLLRSLTARQLTLMMYAFGSLVLFAFTDLASILNMNRLQAFSLLFACFNTIFAYGAFTQALHVWQASKVSAVIALAPIFTFISMEAAVAWLPDQFTATEIAPIAYFGAVLVVTGSMLTALGKRNRANRIANEIIEGREDETSNAR